jgi:hypothetical protein
MKKLFVLSLEVETDDQDAMSNLENASGSQPWQDLVTMGVEDAIKEWLPGGGWKVVGTLEVTA